MIELNLMNCPWNIRDFQRRLTIMTAYGHHMTVAHLYNNKIVEPLDRAQLSTTRKRCHDRSFLLLRFSSPRRNFGAIGPGVRIAPLEDL